MSAAPRTPRPKEAPGEDESGPQRFTWGDEHPNRFRWPKHLLNLIGRVSDSVLAKRAGISRRTVSAERKRRGIPPSVPPKQPVTWTAKMVSLLGQAPDAHVARELGIHSTTVMTKRKSLGIPPSLDAPRGRGLEWSARELRLLGRLSDSQLAEKLGVSRTTVMLKRREMGIEDRGKRPVLWTRKTRALLGTMTDRELGRRLGISDVAVSRERQSLGIPPYVQHTLPVVRSPKLKKLLEKPTSELVERHRFSERTVSKLRRELSVARPARRPARKLREGCHRWTAEDTALLGKLTDEELGRRIGVSMLAVKGKRRHEGIAPAGRPTREGYHRWTAAERALLGVLPDEEVAARAGVSLKGVRLKRRAMGILLRKARHR